MIEGLRILTTFEFWNGFLAGGAAMLVFLNLNKIVDFIKRVKP